MKNAYVNNSQVLLIVVLLFLMSLVVGQPVSAQTCKKEPVSNKTSKVDSGEKIILAEQSFIKAVQNNDLEYVKDALKKDPSLVNATIPKGSSVLYIAIFRRNTECANYLIEQGADINLANKQGFAPIHVACMTANEEMVETLINKKVNVNALTNFNIAALAFIAWNGNMKIIESLVKNGADVNNKSKAGRTALLNLASQGHTEAIQFLLSKNADANVINSSGVNPLLQAMQNGHSEAAALLLEHTDDVDLKEQTSENTALHFATLNGDKVMVDLLLNKGANANIQNKSGKTALDYAVKYGSTGIVKGFISKGYAKKTELLKTKENRKLALVAPNNGDVKIVYSGQSGWILEINNKVLVFDYWSMVKNQQPGLVNGSFNPSEMKGKDIYVFASHRHGDHYDPVIHSWQKELKNITYVYGFDALNLENGSEPYAGPEFTYIEDNRSEKVKNVMVTTLKSNDTGQGFLVEVDGKSIYHPGDHALFSAEDETIFKKEVDFISNKNSNIDIAFLPVTGCPSRWQKEFIIDGFFYNIEKLNPKQVFPMHAIGREFLLKEFAELAVEKKSKADIMCVENLGDHFTFNNQAVAKK